MERSWSGRRELDFYARIWCGEKYLKDVP